jgi:hypothetical protein
MHGANDINTEANIFSLDNKENESLNVNLRK